MDDVAVFAESLRFPAEVHDAIIMAFPSDDPMDQPDFDPIALINQTFPNEQALTGLDSFLEKLNLKIGSVDREIQAAIRNQSQLELEGKQALADAQHGMEDLFTRISDIRSKAEMSERMVLEITKDIKSLDYAKQNLTVSITTLNHLHMLVNGIDALHAMTKAKQYRDAANLLSAVTNVMEHLSSYTNIERVRRLADEIAKIKRTLARQISSEFADAFRSGALLDRTTSNVPQLAEGCLVIDALEPDVKTSFLEWFIDLQLNDHKKEYDSTKNESAAWLDNIEKRYGWLKKSLSTYRESCGDVFPPTWYLPEVITKAFCDWTRGELKGIIEKKRQQIDVALLLKAVGRTITFEKLMNKIFLESAHHAQIDEEKLQEGDEEEHSDDEEGSGRSKSSSKEANEIREKYKRQAREEKRKAKEAQKQEALKKKRKSQANTPVHVPVNFTGIISQVFEGCMSIYIQAQESTLNTMIDTFSKEFKKEVSQFLQQAAAAASTDDLDSGLAKIFPTCTDLFSFFSKSIVQCPLLSTNQVMLELYQLFKKFLKLYAGKVFVENLPKQPAKDAPLQLSSDEVFAICLVINTSDYCVEQTVLLEADLKKKLDEKAAAEVSFSEQQDEFLEVTTRCIQLLIRGLEGACEPCLVAMTKMQWNIIEDVGDTSSFVREIAQILRKTIPPIRSHLPAESVKYFTQFCMKFADTFIAKVQNSLYKCRNVAGVGAEQMLLDMQSIRALLVDVPTIESTDKSKAQTNYVRFVTKSMSKAEMIAKVIMTPHEDPQLFVEDFHLKLPDETLATFQKMLEMKGLKRSETAVLLDAYKGLTAAQAKPASGVDAKTDSSAGTSASTSSSASAASAGSSTSATAAMDATKRAANMVKSGFLSVTKKATNVDRILKRFKKEAKEAEQAAQAEDIS
eukprot:m.283634 g.283634  ORF g.283634 m.283634 type:complete len:909 (-) comp54952_c0_seq1:102-2828(-)